MLERRGARAIPRVTEALRKSLAHVGTEVCKDSL